jgi:excisionase family DNA binding protein
VSLRRACEILGVDESTIRRWADTGRLRVYRTPGGHRRFSLANLEEMVAGEGKHRGSDEVERIAVAKIRRHLQRARQQEHGWYATLSDSNRQRLRDLGRRLVEMAGEYLDKRTRRSGLLDEALEIGGAYGSVLMDAGCRCPARSALHRLPQDDRRNDAADGFARVAARGRSVEAMGQVHALGDQVLLGMASAYETPRIRAIAESQPRTARAVELDG